MRNKPFKVTSLSSFMTFVHHFLHSCYVLRAFMGVQLVIVILGGIFFAYCEKIPLLQGVYFSLITSTTVGYGDITPQTGMGQIISVFLALFGTIFFGLLVTVATHAFQVTLNKYKKAHEESNPDSK